MDRILFVLVFVFSFIALGEEDIPVYETVVTEQKFNSSSTVVIDRKEIQKSRAKNLTTLLASQANISIAQSNFQPNSIYLRGGDSSHVLILVDGVPFYDAASVQRTVNLNSLDLKSIQRIEIIKGSQSVVFGGQALSGVIKIDTIPTDVKTAGAFLGQAGSQHSHLTSASGSSAIDDHSMIVVRASSSGKDNSSPIPGSAKTYPTNLGTAEISYVYKTQDIDSFIKAQTSFDKTYIATTAFPSYMAADTDNFQTSTYQAGLTALVKLKTAPMAPVFSVAQQRTSRIYEQDAASGGGMATKQDYVGDLFTGRAELSPIQSEAVNLRVGTNFTEEKLVYRDTDVLKADAYDQFEGVFGKVDLKASENFLIEGGGRVDYKKGFKNAVGTYQAGVTLFKELKLEYSTGIKRPSLFQLYSSYGNVDLQPERSKSYSVTFEHNITSESYFSITGFRTEFENLIITSGVPLRYENVSKTRTDGIEAAYSIRNLMDQVTLNIAIGYQEPRDLDADTWLVRRPLRTASVKIRKDFEKLSLGAEAIHNGDRRDRQSATTYGTLYSYTYFNATAEYALKENLSIFARGQNLTNQKYESSFGFFDEGLSLTTGFETTF